MKKISKSHPAGHRDFFHTPIYFITIYKTGYRNQQMLKKILESSKTKQLHIFWCPKGSHNPNSYQIINKNVFFNWMCKKGYILAENQQMLKWISKSCSADQGDGFSSPKCYCTTKNKKAIVLLLSIAKLCENGSFPSWGDFSKLHPIKKKWPGGSNSKKNSLGILSQKIHWWF